nr:DUF4332 domain-containing protein [Candidatus Freyarchaeota archaeon]
MAGERSSVVGGLLAFFAGLIGVYFSGVALFPTPIDLTPVANLGLLSFTNLENFKTLLTLWSLYQFSSPVLYASLGNLLTVLSLLQFSSPVLYASYGNLLTFMALLRLSPSVLYGGFWTILGLVSGAGVLLLAYPLAAGKGARVVIVGLIGLGAVEIISGFYGKQNMIVIGGVLAIIAAVFGVLVWRAVRTEKPTARVEAKKVAKVPEKAKRVKPPTKAKAVAVAAPAKVPRAKMDAARIEGVGPVYGSRLDKERIRTIADLAKASVDKVASVAQVNPQKAQKWIQMADILCLEEVDQNAAELLVMGVGVTSKKDLANRNSDRLYEQMQSALRMGKVPVPKGWSFTKSDVEKWINAAKGK